MSKALTLKEIKDLFQSEWILIEDPETSPDLEIKGGKVIWHSKDRDEIYRKARELRPKHSAVLFTGELPKKSAVIL